MIKIIFPSILTLIILFITGCSSDMLFIPIPYNTSNNYTFNIINSTNLTFSSITSLGNGSYLWNFSDGYSYTTANLSGQTGQNGVNGLNGSDGDDGSNGADGVSVTFISITNLGNGSYNWLFSDGTNYTTGNLTGLKGDKGNDGNGTAIASDSYINVSGWSIGANISQFDIRYMQLFNLSNYYNKSETYNKTEIQNLNTSLWSGLSNLNISTNNSINSINTTVATHTTQIASMPNISIANVNTSVYYQHKIEWMNLLNLPTWNNFTMAQINAQNNNGTLIDVTSTNSYIGVTGTTNKTLTFSETVLNTTIATALATTFYNVTNITSIIGTLSGSLTNINIYDNIPYNISEVGSDMDINITINNNLTTFNQLIVRYKTIVGETHELFLYLWDYNLSSWESYELLTNTDGIYVIRAISVFDPDEHIFNNSIKMRLYTNNIAVATHLWNFDWISASKGVASQVGTELDPLSIHKTGDTPLTANWNVGTYNITAQTFIGNVNASYIENPYWYNASNPSNYLTITTAQGLNDTVAISLKSNTTSPTFLGIVQIPQNFWIGATQTNITGAQINYLSLLTSDIQTQLNTLTISNTTQGILITNLQSANVTTNTRIETLNTSTTTDNTTQGTLITNLQTANNSVNSRVDNVNSTVATHTTQIASLPNISIANVNTSVYYQHKIEWMNLLNLPTWNNYSSTEIGTFMQNTTIVRNSNMSSYTLSTRTDTINASVVQLQTDNTTQGTLITNLQTANVTTNTRIGTLNTSTTTDNTTQGTLITNLQSANISTNAKIDTLNISTNTSLINLQSANSSLWTGLANLNISTNTSINNLRTENVSLWTGLRNLNVSTNSSINLLNSTKVNVTNPTITGNLSFGNVWWNGTHMCKNSGGCIIWS